MSTDANMKALSEWVGELDNAVSFEGSVTDAYEFLMRFANEVARAERERCAEATKGVAFSQARSLFGAEHAASGIRALTGFPPLKGPRP